MVRLVHDHHGGRFTEHWEPAAELLERDDWRRAPRVDQRVLPPLSQGSGAYDEHMLNRSRGGERDIGLAKTRGVGQKCSAPCPEKRPDAGDGAALVAMQGDGSHRERRSMGVEDFPCDE
jgi:hypothetical protein